LIQNVEQGAFLAIHTYDLKSLQRDFLQRLNRHHHLRQKGEKSGVLAYGGDLLWQFVVFKEVKLQLH